MTKKIFFTTIFFVTLLFQNIVSANPKKCLKKAEAIGISESQKKGNLPKELLSVANPTEVDGDAFDVYIGAHANYNYFKLKLDKNCKLLKILEVEYAH